ncbi:DUF6884 domain-containing protein [Streptomyces sp. NPDC002067]
MTGHGEQATAKAAQIEVCDHRYRWLYMAAEQPGGQLRTYLTCACTGQKLGNFGQRAAVQGTRRIAAVPTRSAQALAERNSCEVTGAWEVLDEHTKRALVRWTLEPAPEVEEPAAAAAPAPEPTPAPAEADQEAIDVAGPGIIGPGTWIEYTDQSKNYRRKNGSYGTVVRIGRKNVTWRPFGRGRALRTPLDQMRIRHGAHAAADVDQPADRGSWRYWTLADHVQYGRGGRAAAPAPRPQQLASARPAAQLALFAVDPDVEAAPVEAAGPLVIIPCSAGKLSRPAPAGELYTGSYHVACRRAADALTAAGGTVVILSARHGFLRPDQVIAPYETRMGEPGCVSVAQLRQQAREMGLSDAATVTVLAGAAYTAAAQAVWPHAATPLAGSRGIGEHRARLAALTRTRLVPAA